MLNRPEDTSQIYEVTGSRRTFFTWIGQVAAGASLVGIGLGLVNPLNALADSKAISIADKPASPDCTPCPDPGVFCCRNCFTDANCQPGGHTSITYDYNGGCIVTGGHCPTYIACSRCVSSCPTNC